MGIGFPLTKWYQESNDEYTIDDFPVEIVQAMVQYMYEADFDIPDDVVPTGKFLPFLESVFTIGSKYKIRGLEDCSRTRYSSELEYSGASNELLSSLRRIYTANDEGSGLYGILDDAVWLRVRGIIGMIASEELDFLLQWPDFSRDFVNSVFRMGPLVGQCECSFQESEGVYKIDDFPLCIVNEMVQFLYKGTYTSPKEPYKSMAPAFGTGKICFHEDMFAIGKKYEICHLEEHARQRYMRCLKHDSSDEEILSSLERVYSTNDEIRLRLYGLSENTLSSPKVLWSQFLKRARSWEGAAATSTMLE
ncbi:hypothetical protein E4U42_003150 [Claviceps africana]|uniref:BTB domain-containing protein n=1 Tax=Claviceps africana TaxID=83212 RepID=A0A8K0J9Q9_9HYPO|nr:hypothetical protein E4U42_003150 [Claviceps africana]